MSCAVIPFPRCNAQAFKRRFDFTFSYVFVYLLARAGIGMLRRPQVEVQVDWPEYEL